MIASIHRPTVARVDLGAIAGNIQAIQSRLPDQTQTWAVVKANAYGHGAVPVASHIRQLVDGFCVSNMDEALELRQAGLTEAILILGVILPDQLGLAIEHDLTLTISSLDWFDLAKAEREDWTGLKVHLKVDTGMGRLGLRQLEDINYLLTRLPQLGAEVEGIFTHFATADEADQTQFQEQYQTFCQILDQLVYRPALVHASNSATSIWHGETVFSAVRLGISIYGLNPSGDSLPLPLDLKPALTLQSALVQVKELGPGQTVGYGASYKTKGQEVIGTVPIGYADGWTRDRQDFQVLVDGEFCPIVGRVSMDQLTIRLPKVYPLGTKVTLIGQDGDKEITATDLAKHCQTINYEILCLLSDRVPRNYQ